jgi:hypothetical protein
LELLDRLGAEGLKRRLPGETEAAWNLVRDGEV